MRDARALVRQPMTVWAIRRPFRPPSTTVELSQPIQDARSAIVGANSIISGSNYLVWFDLLSGRHLDRITSRGLISDLSVDAAGNTAVLQSDNIINVYSSSRKRIAQLIAVGSEDWLAFSEEGLFDGSAKALEWAGFRPAEDEPLLTVDQLFNELYTPGLLALIGKGSAPHLPPGINLKTYLQLPGLKSLLQSGDLIPALKHGKAVLCVAREELFSTLKEIRVVDSEEDSDRGCPRRIIPKDQSNPPALYAGLETLMRAKADYSLGRAENERDFRFGTPSDRRYQPVFSEPA